MQVLLPDSDRGTWDAELTAEGLRHTEYALGGARSGPFTLQAAIAAEHASAATFDDTDWSRIVTLYGALLGLEPSPTLALGRCLALSYVEGPGAGLDDIDQVMALGRLDGYCYAHAARAQMLDRLGRRPEARRAWIRAASTARTDAERVFFQGRAAPTTG